MTFSIVDFKSIVIEHVHLQTKISITPQELNDSPFRVYADKIEDGMLIRQVIKYKACQTE